MLVFTRRIGDGIRVGDDVRVTVLAINGSKVRLGFEAPSSVTVLRGEVFLRDSAGRMELELDLKESACNPAAGPAAAGT